VRVYDAALAHLFLLCMSRNRLLTFSFHLQIPRPDRLRDELASEKGELFAAFRIVLEESKSQMRKAGDVLRSKATKKQLKHVISHYLCLILQNKAARYYQLLFDSGILLQREVRHYLEEIEKSIHDIRYCGLDKHPGSIEYADESSFRDTAMPRRRRKKQKSIL